jgi:hypothetical protein
MSESILDAAWWPLHVAIGWVITREPEFTERVGRHQHAGKPAKTFCNDVDAAWTRLHNKIRDGFVPAEGKPFRRFALNNAGDEISDSRQYIAPAEIGSLEYHQNGNDLCLVPTEWRVRHESNGSFRFGYRDVHIDKKRLVLNFPAPPPILTSDDLGPPMQPQGAGFMPLSQAAYWIATKGALVVIENVEDNNAWQDAYRDMLDHIASGEVEVVGRQNGYGTPTKIEGHRFSGICVEYPYSDTPNEVLFGDEPHLSCYPFIDEEHWRREFNDKLMADRNLPEFTHLEVKKSDVARLWPSAPPTPADASTSASASGNTSPVGAELRRETPAVTTKSPHLREKVKSALVELYGSSGRSPGVTDKMLLIKVNEWLAERDLSKASLSTIRRARCELRRFDHG